MEKLARILTRKPKMVALIAVLLLIPSLIGFINTRVNYDILTYLPKDLESSQGMDMLEEPFHMAATSMLIVEDMPAGYSNELINEIKNVDGVSNAVWISNVVGIQIPTEMIPAQYRDMFFSGKATMMLVQYEKAGASEETMQAIKDVRGLCNEKCFLAGFSVLIEDTKELVDQELPIFIILAVVLALIAMGLTLSETALPFVLIANIGLAVVYNFGTNIFMGEISYITKAIAAVLQLGVTMDYSIFLYRRYEEERDKHEDKRDAMQIAVLAAFRSLTGSSLTTVAGFLALCTMQLTLGRDIGLVMAKGVVLGVLTVICIMPSIVLLSDKYLSKYSHKIVLPDFEHLNKGIVGKRVIIALLALVILVPSLYGEMNVTQYYKLDESLPQDLPSIVANNKLKQEFDMATQHFVILSDSISNADMLAMEDEIEAIPGITGVVSYHSLLGCGIPDFFIPEELKNMLKQEGKQMMMINSSCATASPEVSAQIEELRDTIKGYDPDALITGESVLTDDLIEVTAVDFKVTNYISIAAIFIIIAIIFKSLSVPVVLVATIELAIIINQGISYFTGAEVAFVAPTVISCVQLGATVDYSILMASRFQEELRKGHDRFEAARIAATSSDASIITSALVMFCATLGVSFVSSIQLIGDICIMLSRGAIISAVVCIFLLPALLCIFEPVFAKTSIGWKEQEHESRLLKKLRVKFRT